MPTKKKKVHITHPTHHKHPKHSALMWIISLVVVGFAYVTVVPAMQQVDASGTFSLAAKKATPKKAATKKAAPVKINKALFHNANYFGPFPAPEGKVLEGTYGEDKYWKPTGSGDYRFHVQTAWERNIQCLDKTRTIDKSKGPTWEKGFIYGRTVADAVATHIDPVFDDTPKGAGKGKALYDEGYRIGYNYRWAGNTDGRFSCPPVDGSTDLTQYDSDGWAKNKSDKLKTIKTLYSRFGSLGNSSQSVLGGDSISLDFNAFGGISEEIEKSSYNNKTDHINLSRIDFLETDTSAEELAMGPEGIMKALYAQQKAETQKKYANTVAFIYPEPVIETQTYGKNKITVLQYVVAHDGKWNLVNYGLRIDPKTNVGLLFSFYNPQDISNASKDGLDMSKSSSAFLAQLLTKIEFANY